MSKPDIIKKLKEKNPELSKSDLESVIDIFSQSIETALKDFKFTTEGPSGETIRNTEALNKLAVIFKDTPDVFLDVIEDLDISRDEFYDDFATKIINKNFASPLQAINELRKFEASLGKTITDEDTTELNELKNMITRTLHLSIQHI